MTKKFFLFFLAAFLATTTAWAECPQYYVDTIPAQRYITNFQLIWNDDYYECPAIKFEDNFRTDLQLNRRYYISMKARHSYDLSSGCMFRYITQADEPSATLHWNRYEYWPTPNDIQLGLGADVANRPLSNGGTVVQEKMSSKIMFAVQKGVREVIFFVNPQYENVNAVTGEAKYVSYYGEEGNRYNLYNINYFTCTLPAIVRNTISAPAEVRSGNELHIEATIQALGQTNYKLQERVQGGEWNTILAGALTSAEARRAETIQYDANFGNGHAPVCEYRMIARDIASGAADTSDIKQVQFLYKRTLNGQVSYYSAADTWNTYVPSDCEEYKVTSELPVEQKVEGGTIKWTMPACDVDIRLEQAKYTVTFVDYDYTTLKTQEVDCGEDATAPTTPTHANMTFDKWSDSFTNVKANTTVRALYTVSGVSAELSIDGNPDYVEQGQSISFNMYVKASAAAQAAFQYAWLDNEGEELSWEESSTKTSYTAAEAGAGTLKVRSNVTVLPTGSTNYGHRARFFRLRVRLSGSTNDIYSNVLRLDTYYPVNIYSEKYTLYTQTHRFTLPGNGTIYSRPLDTIWVRDVESDACHLQFSFTGFSGVTTGSDENGDYLVMPAGSGEGGVTVKHEKFKVVFFVPGHGNNYWETIYGAGAYDEKEVECGQSVALPEPELGEGELLRGWAPRGTAPEDGYLNVTSDMQFDALIESINMHTVTFKDWDGSTLKTESVYDGENATPPTVGERKGYIFTGWDGSYTTVTEDRTLTAQYDSTEGVEDVQSDRTQSNKFLRDGVLYIERNGRIFNAQGAEVK